MSVDSSEELVSLDDEGDTDNSESQILKAPLSPLSSQEPFYNPLGSSLSPGGRYQASDVSSFSKNQVHSVNAVHMHIQENAKVPNLHQSIDRSNSSRPSFASNSKMDGTVQDSVGSSMAELFLNKESSHRRSLEQNYESLGNFLTDEAFDEKRSSDVQIEIDSLTTNIDPTPWSEIERKFHTDEEKVNGTPSNNTGPPPGHPHQYNYYPYGRHCQLPIPQKPVSPNQNSPSSPVSNNNTSNPNSTTMAQAIATAAAIASTQTVTTSRPAQTPNTTSIQPSPYTKAQQTAPLRIPNNSASPSRPYQRQRAAYSPPQHSVAHTANRASVIAAANKKSQYGFGGNHAVPSVPGPPPVSNGRFNKIGNDKIPTIPNIQRGHQHIQPPNSGAAYERKKQRAKDARVKLNEAIERLSIAMSLAGSQSKQRNQFLNLRIIKTEERTKSLQTSAECAKLAEQAKKWDRPSFVGTAASLVQELNSQCESLLRELVAMHERLNTATHCESATPLTSHPEHKRQGCPTPAVNGGVNHESKRIKPTMAKTEEVNPEKDHPTETTLEEKSIYKSVREFLDPISLVQCSCVSKGWRDMEVFDNDDTWLNLAVKRFGFYKVRQWTERLEDTEESEGKKISRKALYRSMNVSNVMPHIKQENLILLGDGKIKGRVSGWVFVVERSNGETLRSVKTEPELSGETKGSYRSQPVVELRIVIQNTGMGNKPVIIRNQQISVDISTRRTGGELKEITWDERFAKVVKTLEGEILKKSTDEPKFDINRDLCQLKLFETVVLEVFINARGCSTTSKFQQRSTFTKLLVCLDGTTIPMVIPFVRDITNGTG